MTLGSQLALQAAVRDPGGQVVPGATVFWSSLDTTIATVTVTGVVTGRRIGSTQIAASSGGQSAVVPVAVIPVPVASVALLPATANIVVPGSVALKAVTYDATGTVLTGRVVVWASSAAQIATVDTSGKVTGITAGSATITATSEGRTGSAQVVVTQPPPAPVATVSVSPATSNLQIGAAEPLTATPRDSAGTALTGRAITWATSAATVATVSSTGIVTALGAGTATIAAASEGKTGTATVVVPTPPPTVAVASVRVTPAATSLRTNQTRTLTAKAYDANGNELSGRTITWESSDDQAVPVSQTGPSTATVTAATRGFGAILI
ncbi:MAG: Ig domain-containing protein, partial [Gemmatimonadales bacterium]